MKSIFFFLISFGIALSIPAQNDDFLPFNLEENLRRLGSFTPTSSGAIGYDLRYEGVKGTPFMFDEWLSASLRKDGKLVKDADVKYKIHTEQNRIYAQFKSGITGSFPVIVFEEIHLEKDGKTLILRPFRTVEIEGFSKGMRLYEVVYNGTIQFLKKYEKNLKEADYKGAYSQNVRYDEYISRHFYFIQSPQSGYQKIVKLKKKALIKALPEYEDQILDFVKKENARLETEQEVVAFLKSLERE